MQGSFFAAYAGTSFFSYILLKKEIPNVYIGLLGALTSCSSTVIQPIWGILCDRYRCHRVFYIISSLAIPLLYLCIIRSNSLPALAFCALLSGLFINCIQNMGSGWISSLNAEGYHINYGASRSCGSLAFAVMAAVFGWAVQSLGYSGLVGGMVLCGLVCMAVSLTIPKSSGQRPASPDAASTAPGLAEGIRMVTGQREYMVVVWSGFLAMSGIAGVNSYFSAYLAVLGASASAVGLGNFTYAIAEVPFLFLFKHLSARFSFRALFTMSLLAHGLQCVLVGLSPNYVCAILSMLLQGVSFGTLAPCLQQYTTSHIDPRYISTAQLFTSAVSLSASMIAGSLLASALSRHFPLSVVFLLISLVSFSGCALYSLYTIYTTHSSASRKCC
ncbi:Major Facilitator Superfamily protein [Oscillibacter sp. PC13]|uniref:MFS transporter n=1 Tax=Oscillibacter sp. PC13 TaxID=1855299 RepID=UPI0008EB13D5|nr:MFS transporter [Oscillibacter sp. PC13]SFP88261.1 Major Facilitator Superfamily protein [Oscillibacter sp. PC13]